MTAGDIETAINRFIEEVQSSLNLKVMQDQFLRILPTILAAFLLSVIAISGTVVLAWSREVELSVLTRDPGIAARRGFYVGVLSTAGVILWTAATSICFFGAFLLFGVKPARRTALFLLSSAGVSLMLTLDDAFLLHERVFPTFLDVPERLVYLAYLLVISAYFVSFLSRILRTDYFILALAVLFLGLSLTVEALFSRSNLQTFAEDCLKFTGIVFWAAYYVRTTFMSVRSAIM